MTYKEKYQGWLCSQYIDETAKKELRRIQYNEKEIEDRFYKDLEFGTGGLRGIIGMGTNRINIYTVQKATQGLANYIILQGTQEKGVVIAYDSRHMSSEFSKEAALCLNANGIKTYRFDTLRPTPELSFAVRELGCTAGIVITASHNPAEYNGYKVYWEDGAQITSPRDKEIISEVNKITEFSQVKSMTEQEAEAIGLYCTIGEELDDKYIEALKKQVIHLEYIQKISKDIKIVYTPLHGTGNILVRRILSELGFEQVYVVPEQEYPNGSFPTVPYPNPEEPKAFEMALNLAQKVDADIVLATDPDADRLGAYVKNGVTGKYVSFTGNMLGVIIAYYIFSQRKENHTLPVNGTLIRTIVTTKMADALANDYNINLVEVLTGFKYIGEKINLFEKQNIYQYVFGFEESYGCLVGTHSRDKDAVVAAMILCEIAAFCKLNGKTLLDQMMELYNTYGFYKEDLNSIVLQGADGMEKISRIMKYLRENSPKNFGKFQVSKIRDYMSGKIWNIENGAIEEMSLPRSNVLYYDLKDDEWCCIRPSGTEPKIKCYVGVKGIDDRESNKRLKDLSETLLNEVKNIIKKTS